MLPLRHHGPLHLLQYKVPNMEKYLANKIINTHLFAFMGAQTMFYSNYIFILSNNINEQ